MYSPYSDLEKMFWTPSYILFRCLIDGEEHLGRPKDIHMGDIHNQKFKHCRFQYWDSIGQYFSGTMPKLLEEIKSSQVVGLEAIDTISKKEPSTLSKILTVCNEISLIENNADIGFLIFTIPEILGKLSNVIGEYGEEHPKSYTGNPIYYINEMKAEFENIDPALNSDQYRKDKIINLKEKVSLNIHQMFSLSGEEM